MSGVSTKHGPINRQLGKFIIRQHGRVAELLEADLLMVGNRMEELRWRTSLMEDNVVVQTLAARYSEHLTRTWVARMEVLVMRELLPRVCGISMMAPYQTRQRSRIVAVMFAVNNAGLKLVKWEEWEGRLQDEHAIAIALFRKLAIGQLHQLQRQLNQFVEDRALVAERLKAASSGPLKAKRSSEPLIEKYRKAARSALLSLDEEQEERVERLLTARDYRAVAELIAPAVV